MACRLLCPSQHWEEIMRKERKQFFIRLIPPRASFTMDITEPEKAIMQEHAAYWQKLLRKNIAVAFGPVFDPKGGYGIGIVEVMDENEAREIMAHDPTIKAGQDFSFEIHAMKLVKK
jgi:uncharacterized protein YciI